MKKVVKLALSLLCATIIITSIDIYADEKEIDDVENTYVEHNYKTGKDKKIKIISDLVEKSNYSADERISMPYTPKRSNGDLSTMNILPNESLKKVDATAEPYCKVTYLYIGRDNNHDGIVESWAGGTGFMVHDDIMLTAGHCMYNKDNGNVEEMRIYEMQNSSKRNSKYYYPLKWVMSDKYVDRCDSNYDWCVVVLQNRIGKRIGWFGYGIALKSKNITVSGYPDYKAYQYYQYKDSGKLSIDSKYTFSHTCSTRGGESGAPAYDSNNIVWGIHTSGGEKANYGCLITSALFDVIERFE